MGATARRPPDTQMRGIVNAFGNRPNLKKTKGGGDREVQVTLMDILNIKEILLTWLRYHTH